MRCVRWWRARHAKWTSPLPSPWRSHTLKSNFDAGAESNVGARGVMQIMPATAASEYAIHPDLLWDARINIRLGIHFLDRLLKRYHGRTDLALSFYNGGSRVGNLPNARVIPATYGVRSQCPCPGTTLPAANLATGDIRWNTKTPSATSLRRVKAARSMRRSAMSRRSRRPAGNPKYSDNVLKSLARTIACRSYATSVLQLCHLVNAADALGRGPERYERLFFDGKRAAAASFQGHISDAVARRGWRRPGFDQTGQSITIEYADGRFEIYYSRMAFLCALSIFACGGLLRGSRFRSSARC